MPVVDLSAYKPVPATLGDANQIANGFQAVQNAINALDNNNFAAGKIFDPLKLMQDGATPGQALVWSAAANGGTGGWVPGTGGQKVTTSTLAGGPPASPADGDVWIATSVTANGERWAFQYDAAETTYKWKFIGGPDVAVRDNSATARQNSVINTYEQVPSSPTLTLARAGFYRFVIGGFLLSSSSAQVDVSIGVGGVGTILSPGISLSDAAGGNVGATCAAELDMLITGAAAWPAGTAAWLVMKSSIAVADSFIHNLGFAVIPTKII